MPRFLDPELKSYTGPWPPYPGMHPMHLRDTGFVLELAVWDADVSERVLSEDLAHMEPDTEPMMLTRVNFGTPDEIVDLVCVALETKTVNFDISGTTPATRAAFRAAFSRRGIAAMAVLFE